MRTLTLRPLLREHQVRDAWANAHRLNHDCTIAAPTGTFVTPEYAALTEAWLDEAHEVQRTEEGTCLSCGRWDNCPQCYEQAPYDPLAAAEAAQQP